MSFPESGDFIDIHNHGGKPARGRFSVENLMAHEKNVPDCLKGIAYTIGIHPWYLDENSLNGQLERVRMYAGHKNVVAVGEAGFDRLRGPAIEIQKKAFESQIMIAEEHSRAVFIHCVKAWDELLAAHKRLKPSKPWLIHGFRGKKDLALQLLSRGMYISFWFEFVIRPEAGELIKSLPVDRIFFETDGSGEDIKSIYQKVASDLGLQAEQLKKQIYSNFVKFFNL